MPPSSRAVVLSLLLVLLGAVVATQQSEASTPFLTFDEAVQPTQQEGQPNPMSETIGVPPASSWSSWLRTIFTNALRLLGFGLGPPMAATEANVAGKLAMLATNTSGKCIIKPGTPVGYKTVCESAKDAAACAALNLTCTWEQPTPHPSPPTLACTGSSKNLTGSECLAWRAFFNATGGGGCSRDDPCACSNTKLKVITCQDGHITGMSLAYTSISGSIPNSISALTALYTLSLDFTSISGSIPNSISALTAMLFLEMQDTRISGSIPDSISALTILKELGIPDTTISGSIPNSISALTALGGLFLAYTSISGSIPDSISALTALEGLQLFNTSISGSIPNSISALTVLDTLFLQDTHISGSIPESFCDLDDIQQFCDVMLLLWSVGY